MTEPNTMIDPTTDLRHSVNMIQIGDHPLTMRMARQLDIFGLTALDVVGRVRLGAKRKPEKGFRLVIGTLKDDGPGEAGTLALAAYRRYTWDYPWWIDLNKEDKVTICSKARYDTKARHWISYVIDEENPQGIWKLTQRGGLVLEINTDNVVKCEVDHRQNEEVCTPYWSCDETIREEIERQMQEGRADQELHRQAGKSPLIVLP